LNKEKWSNKEKALLLKYYALGYDYYTIASNLGRTYNAVDRKLRELGATKDIRNAIDTFISKLRNDGLSDEDIADLFGINLTDLQAGRLINYRLDAGKSEDIWDVYISLQKRIFRHRNIIDDYYIDLGDIDNELIAVIPLADLHIGNIYTDYERMKKDIEYISNMEHTYVILLGDLVDNYTWKKTDDEMMGIKMQLSLLEKILETLQDKIIAIIAGDHEKFTETASQIDIYRDIFHKYCINWGTRIVIRVNDNQYRIIARHRYTYNSSHNLTNTVKKMMEKIGDAEIGIIAHGHIPDYEMFILRGRPRWAIRTGSYKYGDDFLEKIGVLQSQPIFPVILLGTNKFYINVVPSFKDANFYIKNAYELLGE